MLFAKLSIQGFGEFWLQVPLTENLQAEQWAQGLAAGWNLGRQEEARVVDLRGRPHPSEPLRSIEWLRELLQPEAEPPEESPL